jgi:hypothetical protein
MKGILKLSRLSRTPHSSPRFAAIKTPLLLALFLIAFFVGVPLHAHVGSPDVFVQGEAGPYKLFVTVRPPIVIPGVAEIEVRLASPGVTHIDATPMPLTGEASKHPPVPEALKQSLQDPQFYTGTLWIMASGSWQMRFTIAGNQGSSVLSIPVPATASMTNRMQPGLAALLSALGIFLALGMIGIVGAGIREAIVPAGTAILSTRRRPATIAMSVALVVIMVGLYFANMWWKSDAASYASYVYKPLTMQVTLQNDQASGSAGTNAPMLDLKLTDPGWLESRHVDDLLLDHDHLMHFYLLRQPGLDVIYHLHPDRVAPGEFRLALPSVPAGKYYLYADIVHATGFPETLTAMMTFPEINGRQLSGDDAKGTAEAITLTDQTLGRVTHATLTTGTTEESFKLPDGFTMVWNKPVALHARQAQVFEFRLIDPNGNSPKDMSLYMGMQGHAAFVKTDGSVFAHLHPSGSASMAAMMIAANEINPDQQPGKSDQSMAGMSGMQMSDSVSNTVGFPYGFPSPGTYRLFVQMKHSGTVETGIFDALVER